jgi:UDP-2,3-diacylglucosamine hydrolase
MRDKVFFFSDAHLGCGNPAQEKEKEDRVISFLGQVGKEASHLYIVGDLFDFWFEYRYLIPKNFQKILNQLGRLKDSGVKIDYLCGNHDFWLGDFLPEQMEIPVHRDFLEVEHQSKKIFISHGDGLAKSDWGYRILKKILRNKINIWLYRQLPPDFSIPFAKLVSGTSRDYTSGRETKFLEEYRQFAEEKIKSGFDIVILGHTHQPQIEKIENGTYVNLGDWFNHFSYAVLENGEIRLQRFNP